VAHKEQTQDLDARRTIITITTRSRSTTIKYLYPTTEFAVTSFIKKEKLTPPLTPRGFLLPGDHRPSDHRATNAAICDLFSGVCATAVA
jgi:hypothetical protein